MTAKRVPVLGAIRFGLDYQRNVCTFTTARGQTAGMLDHCLERNTHYPIKGVGLIELQHVGDGPILAINRHMAACPEFDMALKRAGTVLVNAEDQNEFSRFNETVVAMLAHHMRFGLTLWSADQRSYIFHNGPTFEDPKKGGHLTVLSNAADAACVFR